jgi:hypothetical protein
VHILELVSVRSTWRVLVWGALQSNDTSNNVSHYTQQRRHLPQDLDSFRSQLMLRDPKTESVDLTSTINTPGITWTLWEMARDEVCHWPVTLLIATIEYPGLYSRTLSASRNYTDVLDSSDHPYKCHVPYEVRNDSNCVGRFQVLQLMLNTMGYVGNPAPWFSNLANKLCNLSHIHVYQFLLPTCMLLIVS